MAQSFVTAGEDAIPERLRTALASLVLDEQTEQRGILGQVNPQLRKRAYTKAEIDFRKRNRRDVRAAAAEAAEAD